MKNLFATPPLISITRKLAAGAAGVAVIEVPGSFFRIKEATGAFSMKIDYGADFEFALGMAYTCPLGTGFKMLTVTNLTAEENVIEILISGATEQGIGTITDDRLNIIRERGAMTTVDADSRLVAHEVSIPANSGYALPPTLIAGDIRRKAVIVSNGDATSNRLLIRDAAGVAGCLVEAKETAVVEVSGFVEVYNPNPIAVQLYASEIYWRSAP